VHARGLCLHAEVNAVIGEIGDRIVFLRNELRERLAGILVVERNVVAQIRLDGAQHGCPIGPFRRAVVADHVRCSGRAGERDPNRRDQQQQDGFEVLHRFLS
jgi:hypothetical protein